MKRRRGAVPALQVGVAALTELARGSSIDARRPAVANAECEAVITRESHAGRQAVRDLSRVADSAGQPVALKPPDDHRPTTEHLDQPG